MIHTSIRPILFLILITFACKQTDQTLQTPVQSKGHLVDDLARSDNSSDTASDTPMSDSTITELIRAASSAAQEPQQIDYATCEPRTDGAGLEFGMAQIGRYHNEVENFVEYCLYEFTRADMTTYIIFNNEIESHYSPYFKLLKVVGNDTLPPITIAQIYGNEQYDYILSAKAIGEDKFELTKQSTYRYIQGIGKVDSTRTDRQIIDLW